MGKRSFSNEFYDLYKSNGGIKSATNTDEWLVDNLSYDLGQVFILTGEIRTKVKEINGRVCIYIILRTKCGRDLSLTSLMGVSSLKGYDLENKIEIDYIDINGKRATRIVQSELINNFNFAETWQPPTRNYLKLAAMIAEKDIDLAGATVTYLGTVYKPFIAKRKGEYFTEQFESGFKRINRIRLWSVKMLK
jgi:hypothetical protein